MHAYAFVHVIFTAIAGIPLSEMQRITVSDQLWLQLFDKSHSKVLCSAAVVNVWLSKKKGFLSWLITWELISGDYWAIDTKCKVIHFLFCCRTKQWINLDLCGLFCGCMTYALLAFGMFATSVQIQLSYIVASFKCWWCYSDRSSFLGLVTQFTAVSI